MVRYVVRFRCKEPVLLRMLNRITMRKDFSGKNKGIATGNRIRCLSALR